MIRTFRCYNNVVVVVVVTLLLFSGPTTTTGRIGVVEALSSLTRTHDLLVVGATGGTGWRALNGLLQAGFAPNQIRVVSRNPTKLEPYRAMGFGTAAVDLNDPPATYATAVLSGCWGCYLHSTSGDTKQMDTGEERRARNLAAAIQLQGGDIKHVVYNSAAAEPGHGVRRVQQKHNVERMFREEFPDIQFTSLRANLFMEELWKGYTRPAILKGTFPFSVPHERKLYLTSVKDMGWLAGKLLLSREVTASRTLNVVRLARIVLVIQTRTVECVLVESHYPLYVLLKS
jgi:uncharacterized protein YbjT (DUF2867 family)